MDLYRQCPACFYNLVMLDVKQPRGPYPTLPNGIDECLKNYMDQHRGTLPPELAHLAGYRLMDDQSLVNTFRQWNGLKCVLNIQVNRGTTAFPNAKVNHTFIINSGIDDLLWNPNDLLWNPNDLVTVLDCKSKKDEPPEGYGDKYYQNNMDTYAFILKENGYDKYYQNNMDTYAFILKENGYKVSPEAFLWYWWPEEVDDEGKWVFGNKTLQMTVNPDRLKSEIEKIAELLPGIGREKGEYAKNFPSNPECGYCSFVEERKLNDTANERDQAG
jgi:hypothetical protein